MVQLFFLETSPDALRIQTHVYNRVALKEESSCCTVHNVGLTLLESHSGPEKCYSNINPSLETWK